MIREWPYTVRLFRGREVLLQVSLRTEAALLIELEACKARIQRGEATVAEVTNHEKGTTSFVR